MPLIWPEFLGDLSIQACCTGLTFGFALWLFGWRWHRFWIVLGSTLTAGFGGLILAQQQEMHALACALVCSIVAGALALTLVRLVAFAVGGGVALLLLPHIIPTWDRPILTFIGGGLLGVYLFRMWFTALTSLLGSMLMVHSTLCLLEHLRKMQAEPWAIRNLVLLGWVTLGVAVAGLVVQLVIERRRSLQQRLAEKKAKEKEKEKKDSSPKKSWWSLVLPMYRQAG